MVARIPITMFHAPRDRNVKWKDENVIVAMLRHVSGKP
jgi:hypothetical protein